MSNCLESVVYTSASSLSPTSPLLSPSLQYYTHRQKMRQIGREQDLEKINRTALKIAREIAEETNTLFAGGVCQTNIYIEGDKNSAAEVRAMYEEQVCWSKEEGAEYIIAETLSYLGEAEIALDVIKSFDLPAVVTFAVPPQKHSLQEWETLDNVPLQTACRKLLDQGAMLVGTNCFKGPVGTLRAIKQILKECPPEKVCALPVAYRMKEEQTFFDLTDEECPENNPVYPRGMDACALSPVEITQFTKQCLDLGLQYLGICCGNSGNYTRAMAEAMGRRPPASRYVDTSNRGKNPTFVKKELETLRAFSRAC